MDEIDANESPLAPQTEGGFSIAFYSVKTETPTKKYIYLLGPECERLDAADVR